MSWYPRDVKKDVYTHTKIAQKIIDMGYGVKFIAIAIGMLSDRDCDLNGQVGYYVKDMDAITRKAIHTLIEDKE